MNELALLAQIRGDASAQFSIATATLLPFERQAVATYLTLPPRGVDDPLWADLPTVGRFFRERLMDGLDESTRVAIAFDDQALYVRFECDGAPARANARPQYYHSDCVELFLDPAHDHYHYIQLAIVADGTCVGSRRTRPLDSQRWETKGKADDRPLGTWQGQASISKSGWSALFTVPFSTLELKASDCGPLGINLSRQRCDELWEYTHWNETYAGAHAPWGFGQLYLRQSPSVAVEQVNLGELRLWENRGELLIRNSAGQELDARLNVSVTNGANGEQPFYSGSVAAKFPAGDGVVRVPFSFPFNPDDYRWNNLHLELTGPLRQPLWKARYHFGRGWPGWLLQIDDRREGSEATNPAPDEADFMLKKRRYIIRRLPRFVRKTTAQGAPSDFTLEAADGSVRFDLMQAGALQRIADYVYARYDNDIDRLLGATFFVHQTAVMTYANTPTHVVTALGPLSILRFGSAQCCCSAAALLGILEKLKCEETARPYRGSRVGVPGHVTTVVEYRGKRVHLDPSVGRFYYLRDNKTLASMEDLLSDPALAARAGFHLEEFHRKAAQSPDAPIFYRPDSGVWPPGAPAE